MMRPRVAPTTRHGSPIDDTLGDTGERTAGRADAGEAGAAVLVLLWSRDEPERVGEAVHVPADDVGTIGRAIDEGDDGATPLSFARMRPAGAVETGPLRSARVSRRQLLLAREGDDAVRVEQLGSGVLRLDGHAMTAGVLRPGGLVELEHRLVLLYTTRPSAWLRPRAADPAEFAFGAADHRGVVGESPAAWDLRARIDALAGRDEHVLVLGPSGSGKELVVQAIHAGSRRGRGPLVSRNAATIPEALIDAELFGNLRNYPNPGMPERCGLLGEADGGSLLLDEIGELSPRLQAHLLRAMDRGEYQRLGETRTRRADVRVLAATNRDPAELKHDFLARFPHRLTVPGLGARPEDVVLIARHLLRRIAASDAALADATLGPEFVAALVACRFTTHVRELHELLWSALHARSGDVLTPPAPLVRVARPRPSDPVQAAPVTGALTREAVLAALERCGGRKEAAWRELGLRNRYQLHRVLKKLGLP